jgi:hypothetical protein
VKSFIGIWQTDFSMSERSPVLPPRELVRRLESTDMTARKVHALSHEPEFELIADQNSRIFFLCKCDWNQDYVSRNHNLSDF